MKLALDLIVGDHVRFALERLYDRGVVAVPPSQVRLQICHALNSIAGSPQRSHSVSHKPHWVRFLANIRDIRQEAYHMKDECCWGDKCVGVTRGTPPRCPRRCFGYIVRIIHRETYLLVLPSSTAVLYCCSLSGSYSRWLARAINPSPAPAIRCCLMHRTTAVVIICVLACCATLGLKNPYLT